MITAVPRDRGMEPWARHSSRKPMPALTRLSDTSRPFQELERLVFGDVGVVQNKDTFFAKTLHEREQFAQIVFVEVILEVVPPVPVRRHLLRKIVPELFLLHERLGDFCRIGAIRDGQHDLDAIFPESLVITYLECSCRAWVLFGTYPLLGGAANRRKAERGLEWKQVSRLRPQCLHPVSRFVRREQE